MKPLPMPEVPKLGRPRVQPEAVEVLRFVSDFSYSRGYAPSIHEVQEHYGVSHGTAHSMLQGLIEAGWMERVTKIARAIRITEAGRKEMEENDVRSG